jgi:hypothetical protein
MERTAEQNAWRAGHEAGTADALRTAVMAPLAGSAASMPDSGNLRAAWLSGYGYGVSDTAGCIPGHHLASVVQSRNPIQVRTALVPDQ